MSKELEIDLYLEKYLNKRIDLKKLIRSVDFTEEEVEDAAAQHPKLLLEASRFRVQKMRARFQAELSYEKAVAKLSAKYQDKKDENGKRRLTESAVKAKVQLDADVHKLRLDMEKTFAYEKFSELLLEVYRSREKAIKVIIDARWAEAGNFLKKEKEASTKKQSRRMMEEIRNRHRRLED